mgnify:CR=1 FL=1
MKALITYLSLAVVTFIINFAIYNFSFKLQATPFLHEEHKVDSALFSLAEWRVDHQKSAERREILTNELKQLVGALKAESNKYKYIALDTIDNVVSWIERDIARENNLDSFAKLPFGDGYNQVRTRVMGLIDALLTCSEHIILVGHRKKTIIGTDSVEVNVSSLDLSGKLKNYIMAKSDAIGFVYRNDEGVLETITKQFCSNIEFELIDSEINQIKCLKMSDGKTYPPSMYPENDKRLKGFLWRESEQPKKKEDIFEKKVKANKKTGKNKLLRAKENTSGKKEIKLNP